jgi:CrcB protein
MREPLRLEVPLVVALGGALGSLGRWSLASVWPVEEGFPFATLLANVTGAFALGVILVLAEAFHPHQHLSWARLWQPFWATGVLGGFTTFSAIAVEVNARTLDAAITYVVVSVAAGLIAYGIGNAIARRLVGVRA